MCNLFACSPKINPERIRDFKQTPTATSRGITTDEQERIARSTAIDRPSIHRHEDGHGHDHILARFQNPFELAEVVKAEGLEHEGTWRDLFLRSAGLSQARKRA